MSTISIIIPAYNCKKYISETIKSVLCQTYSDYECIIVDDGSTDGTDRVIAKIVDGDNRFKIVQQENLGECAARNTGISLASTPYLTVLDSDDIWHPNFLQYMLNVLQNKKADLVWCHFAMFYDGTNIRKRQPWANIHKTGNIWWDMLLDSEFCMGAWAARTDKVRAAGPFDPSLRVAGDRDFSLRLLALICQENPMAAQEVPQELLFYRQRAGSAVRNVQAALDTEWHIMKKHIEHPGIPPRIRKRAWSFLAFKMAVIAAFGARQYMTAIRWYIKAFCLDPLNLNLYWLPVRKLIMRLQRTQYIDILKD